MWFLPLAAQNHFSFLIKIIEKCPHYQSRSRSIVEVKVQEHNQGEQNESITNRHEGYQL